LAGISSITGSIDVIPLWQMTLGHAGGGISIPIGATNGNIVSWTIAWQTGVTRVRESWQTTLLFGARNLAGKATAEIALQVK